MYNTKAYSIFQFVSMQKLKNNLSNKLINAQRFNFKPQQFEKNVIHTS